MATYHSQETVSNLLKAAFHLEGGYFLLNFAKHPEIPLKSFFNTENIAILYKILYPFYGKYIKFKFVFNAIFANFHQKYVSGLKKLKKVLWNNFWDDSEYKGILGTPAHFQKILALL